MSSYHFTHFSLARFLSNPVPKTSTSLSVAIPPSSMVGGHPDWWESDYLINHRHSSIPVQAT